jgi:hypothetical protein
MPRYKLHASDGSDLGEVRFAVHVGPGDFFHVGAGERVRILSFVPVDEPDSPYGVLLRVEPEPPTNEQPVELADGS